MPRLPVPVDIVTDEEISRSGRTETGRVLHTLAPSYVSTPQTIADGSDHVDPASLRGLGPDQVLILVNGKRRHRSALMHLNGTFGRGTVGTDLERDRGRLDQAHRDPARRRGGAVRLRRDRGRHQHRHEGHDGSSSTSRPRPASPRRVTAARSRRRRTTASRSARTASSMSPASTSRRQRRTARARTAARCSPTTARWTIRCSRRWASPARTST